MASTVMAPIAIVSKVLDSIAMDSMALACIVMHSYNRSGSPTTPQPSPPPSVRPSAVPTRVPTERPTVDTYGLDSCGLDSFGYEAKTGPEGTADGAIIVFMA